MSSPEQREVAIEGFCNAVRQDRVAHAYLLIGDPRSEGVPFAIEMLRRLLCRADAPPCGACPACRQVAERTHPDVVWLEPESKSRKIQIETVRDSLLRRLTQTPFIAGGWRAAVILDADCLTDAAANAFLKMLEEPPSRAILLLLSAAPRSLLPTIVSRCQRIRVAAGPMEMGKWRERTLKLLARGLAANGVAERMARAREVRSLFDEARAAAEAEVEALEDAGAGGAAEAAEVDSDTWAARVGAREMAIRREILETILLWQRDVQLYATGGPADAARWPEYSETLRAQAQAYTPADAAAALRAVEDLNRRIERAVPVDSALDAFLQSLRATPRG